uniref:Phosphatidylinositol 3- and 4-kinase, putative n=1 Tax=Theileria annulata TaxID=5874 RepID=A0A3B0MN28_THEAN
MCNINVNKYYNNYIKENNLKLYNKLINRNNIINYENLDNNEDNLIDEDLDINKLIRIKLKKKIQNSEKLENFENYGHSDKNLVNYENFENYENFVNSDNYDKNLDKKDINVYLINLNKLLLKYNIIIEDTLESNIWKLLINNKNLLNNNFKIIYYYNLYKKINKINKINLLNNNLNNKNLNNLIYLLNDENKFNINIKYNFTFSKYFHEFYLHFFLNFSILSLPLLPFYTNNTNGSNFSEENPSTKISAPKVPNNSTNNIVDSIDVDKKNLDINVFDKFILKYYFNINLQINEINENNLENGINLENSENNLQINENNLNLDNKFEYLICDKTFILININKFNIKNYYNININLLYNDFLLIENYLKYLYICNFITLHTNRLEEIGLEEVEGENNGEKEVVEKEVARKNELDTDGIKYDIINIMKICKELNINNFLYDINSFNILFNYINSSVTVTGPTDTTGNGKGDNSIGTKCTKGKGATVTVGPSTVTELNIRKILKNNNYYKLINGNYIEIIDNNKFLFQLLILLYINPNYNLNFILYLIHNNTNSITKGKGANSTVTKCTSEENINEIAVVTKTGESSNNSVDVKGIKDTNSPSGKNTKTPSGGFLAVGASTVTDDPVTELNINENNIIIYLKIFEKIYNEKYGYFFHYYFNKILSIINNINNIKDNMRNYVKNIINKFKLNFNNIDNNYYNKKTFLLYILQIFYPSFTVSGTTGKGANSTVTECTSEKNPTEIAAVIAAPKVATTKGGSGTNSKDTNKGFKSTAGASTVTEIKLIKNKKLIEIYEYCYKVLLYYLNNLSYNIDDIILLTINIIIYIFTNTNIIFHYHINLNTNGPNTLTEENIIAANTSTEGNSITKFAANENIYMEKNINEIDVKELCIIIIEKYLMNNMNKKITLYTIYKLMKEYDIKNIEIGEMKYIRNKKMEKIIYNNINKLSNYDFRYFVLYLIQNINNNCTRKKLYQLLDLALIYIPSLLKFIIIFILNDFIYSVTVLGHTDSTTNGISLPPNRVLPKVTKDIGTVGASTVTDTVTYKINELVMKLNNILLYNIKNNEKDYLSLEILYYLLDYINNSVTVTGTTATNSTEGITTSTKDSEDTSLDGPDTVTGKIKTYKEIMKKMNLEYLYKCSYYIKSYTRTIYIINQIITMNIINFNLYYNYLLDINFKYPIQQQSYQPNEPCQIGDCHPCQPGDCQIGSNCHESMEDIIEILSLSYLNLNNDIIYNYLNNFNTYNLSKWNLQYPNTVSPVTVSGNTGKGANSTAIECTDSTIKDIVEISKTPLGGFGDVGPSTVTVEENIKLLYISIRENNINNYINYIQNLSTFNIINFIKSYYSVTVSPVTVTGPTESTTNYSTIVPVTTNIIPPKGDNNITLNTPYNVNNLNSPYNTVNTLNNLTSTINTLSTVNNITGTVNSCWTKHRNGHRNEILNEIINRSKKLNNNNIKLIYEIYKEYDEINSINYILRIFNMKIYNNIIYNELNDFKSLYKFIYNNLLHKLKFSNQFLYFKLFHNFINQSYLNYYYTLLDIYSSVTVTGHTGTNPPPNTTTLTTGTIGASTVTIGKGANSMSMECTMGNTSTIKDIVEINKNPLGGIGSVGASTVLEEEIDIKLLLMKYYCNLDNNLQYVIINNVLRLLNCNNNYKLYYLYSDYLYQLIINKLINSQSINLLSNTSVTVSSVTGSGTKDITNSTNSTTKDITTSKDITVVGPDTVTEDNILNNIQINTILQSIKENFNEKEKNEKNKEKENLNEKKYINGIDGIIGINNLYDYSNLLLHTLNIHFLTLLYYSNTSVTVTGPPNSTTTTTNGANKDTNGVNKDTNSTKGSSTKVTEGATGSGPSTVTDDTVTHKYSIENIMIRIIYILIRYSSEGNIELERGIILKEELVIFLYKRMYIIFNHFMDKIPIIFYYIVINQLIGSTVHKLLSNLSIIILNKLLYKFTNIILWYITYFKFSKNNILNNIFNHIINFNNGACSNNNIFTTNIPSSTNISTSTISGTIGASTVTKGKRFNTIEKGVKEKINNLIIKYNILYNELYKLSLNNCKQNDEIKYLNNLKNFFKHLNTNSTSSNSLSTNSTYNSTYSRSNSSSSDVDEGIILPNYEILLFNNIYNNIMKEYIINISNDIITLKSKQKPKIITFITCFSPSVTVSSSTGKGANITNTNTLTTTTIRASTVTEGKGVNKEVNDNILKNRSYILKNELKGDLRKDLRSMDSIKYVNKLLEYKFQYKLRVFNVVIISEIIGLIQFLPNLITLKTLYNDIEHNNSIQNPITNGNIDMKKLIMLYIKYVNSKHYHNSFYIYNIILQLLYSPVTPVTESDPPDNIHHPNSTIPPPNISKDIPGKGDNSMVTECNKGNSSNMGNMGIGCEGEGDVGASTVTNNKYYNSLMNYIIKKEKEIEYNKLYEMSNKFNLSCSIWNIFGYIIGLGDRHTENILIDIKNGDLIHVDYDCLFDKGLKLLIPELVPFRLTPILLHNLGTA